MSVFNGYDATNFNPRPPRGGRLQFYNFTAALYDISIHVLREEDDQQDMVQGSHLLEFQSTSSARRTTARRGGALCLGAAISIHVLREEDDHKPWLI